MNSSMEKPNPPGRLVSHFQGREPEKQASGWSELWDSGENDLWDRGYPSPPLIELLSKPDSPLKPLHEDGSRKKALVPGCGTGYDPVMLALQGFNAYGLEISTTAVETANRYATSQLNTPSKYNFFESGIPATTPGNIEFVQGDFFKRDWEAMLGLSDGQFDVIYDYTFLCALPPPLRKSWAKRNCQLLKPGGLLICLEFPLYKDLNLPGPPWGLKGVYWDLLARNGDGQIQDSNIEEIAAADAKFKRVFRFKPAHSYEQGKDTNMLSAWKKL